MKSKLEERRQRERDRKREKRSNLTEEEVALRRKKDAERKRLQRAQLPDEELALRRKEQTEGKRKLRVTVKEEPSELSRPKQPSRSKTTRPQSNEDKLALRRIMDAARQRERRANLTEEEKAFRRKQEAARKKELRSQLNEEQRALRRMEEAAKQKIYNERVRLSEARLVLRRKMDSKRRENKRKTESAVPKQLSAVQAQLNLKGETPIVDDNEKDEEILLQIRRFRTLVSSLKEASMEMIRKGVESAVDRVTGGKGVVSEATRNKHVKSNERGRKVHKHRKLDPNRRKEMFPISIGDNNFVCIVCNDELETLRGIKLHLTYHSESELAAAKEKYAGGDASKIQVVALTVYECQGCSDKCYSPTTYRKHLVEKHKEHKELLKKTCFPCSLCDEVFIVKMALNSHQRNFHNIFCQCPVCSENFATQESFATHVDEKHLDCDKNGEMVFEYDDGYFCRLCGVCSRSYVFVNSHFKEAHSEQVTFECELCKVKFDTRRSLVRHKHKFHEERSFCCEVCGQSFIDALNLRIHKRKHNSAAGTQTGSKVDCKLCGKTFATKSNYKDHYIKIHQEKRFQCTVCGKSFPYLFKLHQHRVTVCEKDKSVPKPCPICGKMLENYLFLEYHTHNIHKYGNTEETRCHVCNKTFKSPARLRFHNIRHHGNNHMSGLNGDQKMSLKCAFCGKRLTSKTKLLSHWRGHKEEEPFKCSCCGVTFKCRHNFYRHRENVHENNPEIAQLIIDSETDDILKAEFHEAHADQFSKASEANLAVELTRAETSLTLSQHNDLPFHGVIYNLCDNIEIGDKRDEGRNRTIKDYVDFSRSNVPARQETLADAKDSNKGHMSTSCENMTKNSWLRQGNEKVATEDGLMESFDDIWEPMELYSPMGSPMPESDITNSVSKSNEDRKPFIGIKDNSFKDPFTKRLTVEIERLKECRLCDEFFSSSTVYRKHLNSKGHRLALRSNKRETIFIQKKKKINYKEEIRKRKKKLNGNETLYSCPFCDEKLDSVYKYLRHTKEHKRKEESCTICPEKFTNLRKLINHYISEHNGENVVKCETCDKGFLEKKSLNDHIRNNHVRDRPRKYNKKYACEICGERYDLNSFKNHVSSHGDFKHKCVHCAAEFKVLIGIEHHYEEAHNGNMPFCCKECCRTFAVPIRLQQHEERAHCQDNTKQVEKTPKKRPPLKFENKKQFSCSVCNATVSTEGNLKAHMVQHNKRAMCLLCPEGFATVRKLVHHYVAAHNGEKLIKCEICDTPFLEYQPLNLSQHMADQHDIERGKKWRAQKTYSCDVCGVICEGKIHLNSHLITHKKETYKCGHCNATFKGLAALESHYNESHNGDMPFLCEECPLKFSIQRRLQLHQKEVHSNSDDIMSTGNMFEDSGELAYHKTVLQDPLNETEKVFCEVCGKFFFGEASLAIHKREHTGEKPYQCTVCGMPFSSPALLKHHMNKDHEKACHPCDTCGKSYNRRKTLLKHCQTYHTESFQPDLTCLVCSYRCSKKESLDKHMRFHDPTRRYACKICSWRFKKSSNLSAHKRFHTGMGIDVLPHVRAGRPPRHTRELS